MTLAFYLFITDFFFFCLLNHFHFEKQTENSRVSNILEVNGFTICHVTVKLGLLLSENVASKHAWHNVLQVFTRKPTRVLYGGCALVSTLLT